ncbi:PAS domain-containing protein [Desulfatitalea tepidiphila]|uniref:PAS domain-containing protein n=1 Tax=Desulfatitalea tepidiphila TaxID=1185843 RepID=UPI0013792045|nr:PAS domain S-box protein [Desulfatitalea tepidiphila]
MTTTHHDAPSPEEKKYRNILDQMEEGYYETDLTGHFTYVNPAASAHLGRSVDELIGTNYQTYMAVDTAKTIFGIFNQVYLTGRPAKGIECDIIHPDGALRIHEISVSLLRQPSGEPIGFFGISRDRTEQLDMERALRESEESYRSIMDLSPDAITINEVGTGRYVAANKAFFEKTGYRPDEVVGRTPEALKLFAVPEERLQFLEAMRRDSMDGLEVQFRSKDGTVLENLVSGRRIQFKNKPCFLFVSTEIASLKRAQQALRDSEESYRQVLELAPDAISLTRVSDGKYLEVSEAFYQQTGYTRDETVGKSPLELDLYVDPAEREKLIADLLAHGQVQGMEVGYRAKDGTVLNALTSARVMQFKGEACVLAVSTLINDLKAAQEALKESEESYRSTLETAPYTIVVSRLSDGTYVQANAAFYRRTGHTPEQTIGRTAEQLNLYENPADRERLMERFHRDGKVEGMEVRFRSRDGRTLESLISMTPMRYKGEACILSVTVDISELKAAQRALRESEASYRKVIQSTPIAMGILRASDSCYVEVNEAFTQHTGYRREEVMGRTVLSLNMYIDAAARQRLLDELARHGRIRSMEMQLRGKDGGIKDNLISITPIHYKGEACLLTSSVDLTTIKAFQKALQESEENYRKILDGAPYSILITRRNDYRFVYLNDNFCRRMGYDREAVIGRTSLELGLYVNPDDRRLYFKTFEAEGRVDGMEIDFRTKSGEVFTNLMSGLPIRFDGQDCLLSMAVDITGRKRAERELEKYRQHLEEMVRERTQALEAAQAELVKNEKLAVLGQLTATVSHELRNPLGVIRSSNFYLHRKIKEKDAKIDKHLKRIDDQVSMCDAIVADLLEYTRGRNASMVKEALTPWLAQVIQQLKESEGMAIAADLGTDLPAVPHDREKMRRVIINVLDNAIQAVRAREQAEKAAGAPYVPEIRLAATVEKDGVMIQVTDNGTGMEEETLQRAFEPLFTTRARGTGIGLANVKKIVEEHRGSVSLTSNPGEGTQISIALPFGEN